MHLSKPMLGTQLDWENPLNDGLVMHLSFNESSGDVVRDLSMNGNHGAIKNMAFPSTPASGWNPGRTGVGLNFDGTDDYVDCGNNASLNFGTGDFSVGGWANCEDSTGTTVYIINKGNNTVNRYSLKVTNNTVFFQIRGSDGTPNVTASCYITVDKWIYIAGVFNGSNMKLYLDGILQDTQNISGVDLTNNFNCLVGGYGIGENFFLGSIDQVRIHNRALTAKEVQDYYINPWQVYLDE